MHDKANRHSFQNIQMWAAEWKIKERGWVEWLPSSPYSFVIFISLLVFFLTLFFKVTPTQEEQTMWCFRGLIKSYQSRFCARGLDGGIRQKAKLALALVSSHELDCWTVQSMFIYAKQTGHQLWRISCEVMAGLKACFFFTPRTHQELFHYLILFLFQYSLSIKPTCALYPVWK